MFEVRSDLLSRLFAQGAIIAIAAAGVLSGLSYLIGPDNFDEATVREAFGALAYLWVIGYVLGGIGVIVGFVSKNLRIEVGSLAFFSSALAINVMAQWIKFGSTTLLLFGIMVVAAFLARAAMLLKGYRVLLVREVTVNGGEDG